MCIRDRHICCVFMQNILRCLCNWRNKLLYHTTAKKLNGSVNNNKLARWRERIHNDMKAIEFIVNIKNTRQRSYSALVRTYTTTCQSQFAIIFVICYFLANLNNLVNQCNFLISNPFHLQITCYIGTERDLGKLARGFSGTGSRALWVTSDFGRSRANFSS